MSRPPAGEKKPPATDPAAAEQKPGTQAETEAESPEKELLTIETENQVEHDACLAELRALGAVFRTAERIDDANGCGIDKPIILSEIVPGVKLAPEGALRCPAALALARWMMESVVPAAKAAVGRARRLTALNQASAYVCRLRNNAATGNLSEHARGNAIDIASFSFHDGGKIEIEPRRKDTTLTGAFQRTVTASACLYFSTVLDPESDAAHESHLHLDVLKRKGGYRYCR